MNVVIFFLGWPYTCGENQKHDYGEFCLGFSCDSISEVCYLYVQITKACRGKQAETGILITTRFLFVDTSRFCISKRERDV